MKDGTESPFLLEEKDFDSFEIQGKHENEVAKELKFNLMAFETTEEKEFVVNLYFYYDHAALFSRLKNLQQLSLVRCQLGDSKFFETVSLNLWKLEKLDLHSCEWITDPMMLSIRLLPTLKTLKLSNISHLTIIGKQRHVIASHQYCSVVSHFF